MKPLSLRNSLISLLVIASMLTFAIVGGLILLLRLPQIETNSRMQLQERSEHASRLLGYFMSGVEAQLMPLLALAKENDYQQHPESLQSYLDAMAGKGDVFDAVFVVSQRGDVLAVGKPLGSRAANRDLRGADFSGNRLFRYAAQSNPAAWQPIWSDNYLSLLSGKNTVGVAYRVGRLIIIGEASIERVLGMLTQATRNTYSTITVIDNSGQWLASSQPDDPHQHHNFSGHTIFQAAQTAKTLPPYLELAGHRHLVGATRSEKLNWIILSTSPAGFDNIHYRTTVLLVGLGFLGSIIISLLLAPLWASRMARPLSALIDRAHLVTTGDYASSWPKDLPVAELNQLSNDLADMVAVINQREAALLRTEERLRATLNNAPSVSIQWYDGQGNIVFWNTASERMYGYSAQEVVGVSVANRHFMYHDQQQVNALLELLQDVHQSGKPFGPAEFCLRHKQGHDIYVLATLFPIPSDEGHPLVVCMDVDITEQRNAEQALRELNSLLEQKVQERTEALSQSNSELEATIDHLKATQAQLVQSEKIAALGNLVAGVAHELNTPIGNGLMAVSTLGERLTEFQQAQQNGLRRSDLENFLKTVNNAGEIACRNLQRAAELVSSFKQVAVDQTSAQRREFVLSEVVREIVLTLEPSLKRTPFHIESDLPPAIRLDSYPGALGQVLTNLINNAVLHGFHGRDHGTIHIQASLEPELQRVRLSVSDNGNGISAEHRKRIFDPFFTTKMGQGGTGLGLHICHNAVQHILGGQIYVESEVGHFTRFIVILPLNAPHVVPDAEAPRPSLPSLPLPPKPPEWYI